MLPGFTAHTLAPFDDERIKHFVQAWYTAQCNLGRLTKDPELYTHLTAAAQNVEELTQQLRPILNDARAFSDKIARHPELLGVRGALQTSPGIK